MLEVKTINCCQCRRPTWPTTKNNYAQTSSGVEVVRRRRDAWKKDCLLLPPARSGSRVADDECSASKGGLAVYSTASCCWWAGIGACVPMTKSSPLAVAGWAAPSRSDAATFAWNRESLPLPGSCFLPRATAAWASAPRSALAPLPRSEPAPSSSLSVSPSSRPDGTKIDLLPLAACAKTRAHAAARTTG